MEHLEIQEEQVLHRFRWIHSVELNESNPDCKINFLEYWQIENDKTTHWSWATDLELSKDNVYQIMKAGRARWAIENETFNTLKNQGYSFEHNFGHGNQYLSVIFAMLMMLAFFIDQIQQIACQFFQKARERLGTKSRHWETMRSFIQHFKFSGWEEFLSALAFGIKTEFKIEFDSS